MGYITQFRGTRFNLVDGEYYDGSTNLAPSGVTDMGNFIKYVLLHVECLSTVTLTSTSMTDPTFTSDHYMFSRNIKFYGVITIDAEGDPDAVFYIAGMGTMQFKDGCSVNLVNGAQAENVYFVANKNLKIKKNCDMYGNFLSCAKVDVDKWSTVHGRLLATTKVDVCDDNINGLGVI